MSWAQSGLSVAFGGGDDGALHQDVARPGEAVGVPQAGGFGALAQDRADVAQVLDAGLSRGVSGTQLDQHIDERAAVEVLMLLEPVVEHVEDGQQLLFGGAAAQPRLPLD